MYKIARYTGPTTIEAQPGRYFWKRSARNAANSLNDATDDMAPLLRVFKGTAGLWQVFKEPVLNRAIAHARTVAREQEQQMRTEQRTAEYLRAKAEHPAGKGTQSIKWLDEDPTDHDGLRYAEPEDTDGSHDLVRPAPASRTFGAADPLEEDVWDAANGGSLLVGGELPVRVPGAALELEPLPVNPTAEMTPEDAEKAMAGFPFIPQDIPLTPENDPETAELEKRFQASPVAAQVDAFLSDPETPRTTLKRPARRRSTKTEVPAADDISF